MRVNSISRSGEIREIQEAFEAEGITIDDDADVELTDAEIACFDASGLEPEDLVRATDATPAALA